MNGINSNDTSDYIDITINKNCSGYMCKMFLLHIKNIENKEYEIKKGKKNMQTKYKRLKTFTTILMVVAIISFLVAIFK